MTGKLVAIAFTGAVVVTAGAGTARAAEGVYPPAAPAPTSHSVTARPAPTAPARQSPVKVLGEKQAAADIAPHSTLPHTGAEWAATAAVGGGLLVGGSALVVAARRRRAA